MADLPRERVELKDFPGLMTKPDPDDIQSGAARAQVNIMSTSPGELRVRPGVRELKFDVE